MTNNKQGQQAGVGWREVGWGMIIAGLILVVAFVVVEAPAVSVVLSLGILGGGVASLLYTRTINSYN